MATFRPYEPDEIRNAAIAYGVDPDFAQMIYEVESSSGTNPVAMEPRRVKRKRDTTIVRGPFQLEDGTANDLIKKHKLGTVNVDDPDVHLDLAMRLMSDLNKQYRGDMRMMARRYFGFGTDESGTTDTAYANKVMAKVDAIKAKRAKDTTSGTPNNVIDVVPTREGLGAPAASPLDDISPFMVQPGGEPDIFGNNIAQATAPPMPDLRGASQHQWNNPNMSWSDMIAAGDMGGGIGAQQGGNAFALPSSMAMGPGAQITDEADMQAYIQRLVEEELGSKDFANAG